MLGYRAPFVRVPSQKVSTIEEVTFSPAYSYNSIGEESQKNKGQHFLGIKYKMIHLLLTVIRIMEKKGYF